MKCELCSWGEREPKQRLCLPCIEAVARLWVIASNTAEPPAVNTLTAHATIGTKYAATVAIPPNCGLL